MDSNVPIQVMTYYEALYDEQRQGSVENWFDAGDLVLVCEVANDKVTISPITKTDSYRPTFEYDQDEFLGKFKYRPDGEQVRQQEILNITQEMSEISQSSTHLNQSLQKFNPFLTHDGEVSGLSTDIVAAESKNSPELIQADIKNFRNEVMKRSAKMGELTTRLTALLHEKSNALKIQMENMNALMKKASEAIWTISLYLGHEEEVIQLAEGPLASKDDKISIRQLVLFMDEESGIICVDAQGIDATKIHLFDEWVSKPENYKVLIPEQKGMIALKPRRHQRDYGDPVIDQMMRKANKKTYFLFRNGESVYRFSTNLEVGDRLFPKSNEFDQLFYRRNYRTNQPEPMEIGSHEYMKAMEEAEQKNRHYMRVALVLQGILDRTTIFHPLPKPRVSILNRKDHLEHLKFIDDAENVLGDGRLPYQEWIKKINSKLEIGYRVIGNFSYRYVRKEDFRTSPQNAGSPDSSTLYTIEAQKPGKYGDSYYIRFERSDEIYDRSYNALSSGSSWRRPARRASFAVYKSDSFILNFDEANIDDMKFYCNDRINRHNYEDMLPLLKIAIELKEKEINDEKPFRDLLMGQILNKYPNDEAAEILEAIDHLVKWWKLKNKVHRALLSEDAKALKMIVSEYDNHRIKCKQEVDQSIVDKLLQKHNDAILIALIKPNLFGVIVSEPNPIFVRIYEYEYVSKSDELKEIKKDEWTTLKGKHKLQWKKLYAVNNFEEMKVNQNVSEILTQPEIDSMFNAANQFIENRVLVEIPDLTGRGERFYDQKYLSKNMKPISAHYDAGKKEIIYNYYVEPSKIDIEHPITGTHENPKIYSIEFSIKKKSKECNITFIHGRVDEQFFRRFGSKYEPYLPERNYLFLDENLKRQIDGELHQIINYKKDLKKHFDRVYSDFTKKLNQHNRDSFFEAEYRKFMQEYGDAELWEGHKKKLKVDKVMVMDWSLRDYLAKYIENEGSLKNVTLKSLIGEKGIEKDNDLKNAMLFADTFVYSYESEADHAEEDESEDDYDE